MNRNNFYKGGAYGATALAGVLFTLAVAASGVELANDFYCFGIAAVIVVATCLVLGSLDATVTRVVTRVAAESRACLARSIAQALADEIDRRDAPDNVTPLSRAL